MQKEYIATYREKYPIQHPSGPPPQEVREIRRAPRATPTATITSTTSSIPCAAASQSLKIATFGFRAAGAALLSNLSVERGTVVHWNPETMKLV